MKFKKTLIASVVVLAFAAIALAAGLTNRDDQPIYGHWWFFNTVTFEGANSALDLTDATITATGKITATHIADIERSVNLPLNSAVLSTGSVITSSTAPGMEIDDSIPNIVWADSEATPVLFTFRVPAGYSSGGAFRVIATESGTSTANEVDFDVYINSDGGTIDSSATNQTPVALAGTANTPDVVTLTVGTDFASLAAGEWVTLRIWRDDTATGTNDLEVKGVEFYYTSTQ